MKNLVFSFDDMATGDKASKKLAQLFGRAGAPVVQAAVDSKIKRSSGVSYREMSLIFADGQAITLSVKQSGDVYQVKINGKVQPLKNQDDHVQAVAELVKQLEAGRTKFQKEQAKTPAELPKGIKTAAPKLAVVLKQQNDDLDAQIVAARQQIETLQAELGEASLDSVAAPVPEADYGVVEPGEPADGDLPPAGTDDQGTLFSDDGVAA